MIEMKLSNDARIAVISALVTVVMLSVVCACWSAWIHLFKEDYERNQKMKQIPKVKHFERPEPTPEQKAEFMRRREEAKRMRDYEMSLRQELVDLLKKQKAPVAKIAAAECDLTLAKMRMMRRKRRAQGVSGAEFVVKSYYVAKAVPAKVDMNSEESIKLAIAGIEMKRQAGMMRRFFADEEFKAAAEAWQKEQNDANLKNMCEAEANVPEPAPRKRMMK